MKIILLVLITFIFIALPAHAVFEDYLIINSNNKTCRIHFQNPLYYLPDDWKIHRGLGIGGNPNTLCKELGYTLTDSDEWYGKLKPIFLILFIIIDAFLILLFGIPFYIIVKKTHKEHFTYKNIFFISFVALIILAIIICIHLGLLNFLFYFLTMNS